MRVVTGVDLAAKFSAFVTLSWRDPHPLNSSDSTQMDEETFIDKIARCASNPVLIEDLPYHLPSSTSIMKKAVRMQGMILSRADSLDHHRHVDNIFFVPPDTWQRGMGVWREDDKVTAAVALNLGYTPPDVLDRWFVAGLIPAHGKERQTARREAMKVMSDYVDAFLISWWGQLQLDEFKELNEHPNISRYERSR